MRHVALRGRLFPVLALALAAGAACETGSIAGPSRGTTGTQPCLSCPSTQPVGGGSIDAATRANELATLAFSVNTGLVRWESPVEVSVASSDPSDGTATSQVVLEVASITTAPMSVVPGRGNVVVKFLAQLGCGADALGCTGYSVSGPLTNVEVRIQAGLPSADRTAVLRHELAHAMGLAGHSKRTDSIMYPQKGSVLDYSTLDRWVLRSLYSPRLQVGMTRDSVYAIALKLP